MALLAASTSPFTVANSDASIPSPFPEPIQNACTLLDFTLDSCAMTKELCRLESEEDSVDSSKHEYSLYFNGDTYIPVICPAGVPVFAQS